MNTQWKSVLELDRQCNIASGDEASLAQAIRRGADLRIYTEFIHNEHIDTRSDCDDLVREVSEFRATYLVDDRWVAGTMTLRQPIELPDGFGPRPSMSFFLYNQNGQQACARPFLDGKSLHGEPEGDTCVDAPGTMANCDGSRHTVQSLADQETNAPIINFIYNFECFRYCVCDNWREVLSHDREGNVTGGDFEELTDAFGQGCEVKVAVAELCGELCDEPKKSPRHEVFIQAGPGYHYTRGKQFMVGTHPLVRAAPATPMVFHSRQWDFGWLMLRTDGHTVYRKCNPYTLGFSDHPMRCALRWFVR